MENPKLATGTIEVLISELRILNSSETPPFPWTNTSRFPTPCAAVPLS